MKHANPMYMNVRAALHLLQSITIVFTSPQSRRWPPSPKQWRSWEHSDEFTYPIPLLPHHLLKEANPQVYKSSSFVLSQQVRQISSMECSLWRQRMDDVIDALNHYGYTKGVGNWRMRYTARTYRLRWLSEVGYRKWHGHRGLFLRSSCMASTLVK